MGGEPLRVARSAIPLVLWPALITLAVTLVRLAGGRRAGPDRFFSRAAGGDGAVVGIVWLVPVLGVYFGVRLCAQANPRGAPCGR